MYPTQNPEAMLVQLTTSQLEALIEVAVNRALSNRANTPPAPEKDLMTIKEASQFTGFTVGSIYQMVSKKQVPYMKVSKRLHFSKKALAQWIATGEHKPHTK